MEIYSISPNKTLFELEPSCDHFIDLLGNDFKKIKTINCGGDKHNNQIREQCVISNSEEKELDEFFYKNSRQ